MFGRPKPEMTFMLRIATALNEVHATVWGVLIICLGTALALHHQENIGNSLITGGFALVSTGRIASTVVGNNNTTTDTSKNADKTV